MNLVEGDVPFDPLFQAPGDEPDRRRLHSRYLAQQDEGEAQQDEAGDDGPDYLPSFFHNLQK